MSSMQDVIEEIICKIASTEGAFDHGDSVLYGLKNYIARHSLANDKYFVSEKAFAEFDRHRLGLPLRRNRIGNLKAYFTFEHPVPASLVAKQIRDSNRSRAEVARILAFADCVTLVTKDEDRLIGQSFRSSMPDGWVYHTGACFARYDQCEVKIRTEKNSRIRKPGSIGDEGAD